MTTQILNWKTLGSVEGGKVLIADDQSAELIRVRYPSTLRFGHLLDMIAEAEKEWVYGHLAEVTHGSSEGEMIASFTYPD